MNIPALKAIVAFIGAVAEGIMLYANDNEITAGEVPLIIAIIATLVGVYFVPNLREGINVNKLSKDILIERKRYK